jgi:DNA-binding transcriptional regulator YiaG
MIEYKELKDFRKAHKMTQQEACNVLGYSLRTWQGWESGRKIPTSVLNHLNTYTSLQIERNNYQALLMTK